MKEIKLGKIKPGTGNPRKDLGDISGLVESIKERIKRGKRGLVEPIIVTQETPEPNDTYEVKIGRRRFEAAKKAKLKTVTCIIDNLDEPESLKSGLVENLQRKGLTWLEEARTLKQIKDKQKLTNAQIGEQIGKSEDWVKNRLFALKLVEELEDPRLKTLFGTPIQSKLGCRTTPVEIPDLSTTRDIARAPTKEDREMLLKMAVEKNLSQRDVERMMNNADRVWHKLNFVEITHVGLADLIKDFWWKHRFDNIYDDMVEEINIRIGQPKQVIQKLDANTMTVEQAKEYAKDHKGQYMGKDKETREFYRVSVAPRTIEDIREKWKKN